jgi:hypothetical protein
MEAFLPHTQHFLPHTQHDYGSIMQTPCTHRKPVKRRRCLHYHAVINNSRHARKNKNSYNKEQWKPPIKRGKGGRNPIGLSLRNMEAFHSICTALMQGITKT